MSEKAIEKMPNATEDSTETNEVSQQPQEPQEPKNVQELTNYIQSMLQQMQDRFQTMSDQVCTSIYYVYVKCAFIRYGGLNLKHFWHKKLSETQRSLYSRLIMIWQIMHTPTPKN